MRYLWLFMALVMVGLTGCYRKVSRNDLYDMLQNPVGQQSAYYYMGSKGGWDYIRMVGPNHEDTYRIRPCQVEALWRYKYTVDRDRWTPIQVVNDYRGPLYTKDQTRVVVLQPSTYIYEKH